MLKIDKLKLDKFYFVFIFVMVLLTILVIYTFKTVFSSFLLGNEVGNESELGTTRIDDKGLSEAYDFVFKKESVKLEIR